MAFALDNVAIATVALQIAKRQGVVNPENTFFSVKRFIGRKMAEVKGESTQVPYILVDSSGAVKIKSSNAKKDFSPEEISAQVLRKLVDDAAKFLNDKVHISPKLCILCSLHRSAAFVSTFGGAAQCGILSSAS